MISLICLVTSRYSKSICSRGHEHHEDMIFEMMGSGDLESLTMLGLGTGQFSALVSLVMVIEVG